MRTTHIAFITVQIISTGTRSITSSLRLIMNNIQAMTSAQEPNRGQIFGLRVTLQEELSLRERRKNGLQATALS